MAECSSAWERCCCCFEQRVLAADAFTPALFSSHCAARFRPGSHLPAQLSAVSARWCSPMPLCLSAEAWGVEAGDGSRWRHASLLCFRKAALETFQMLPRKAPQQPPQPARFSTSFPPSPSHGPAPWDHSPTELHPSPCTKLYFHGNAN